MSEKYLFNGEEFYNMEDVEYAIMEYAYEHFDELLDDVFDEVSVAGYSYRASDVLKNTDPILYKCMMADYSSSLHEDVEEVDDEDDIRYYQ